MSEPVVPSVVGVVGQRTDAVRAAVERVGPAVRTGDPSTVLAASPDVVVAVGEHALLDLARLDPAPEVPVCPIDAGPGVGSVPESALEPAVEALVSGDGTTSAYPILGAVVDGTERARALCDLMLVTAEPARISEYTVTSGRDPVSQFRADGVVVATPAGSHGYALSVGAPAVAADTGVGAVAPIAPFATDADHWVLPIDAITLTIERDEAPVELLADDRRVGPVAPHTPLSISRVDTLSLRSVPQSRSQFEDAD